MPKTCLDQTGLNIVSELTEAVKRIDPSNMGLLAIFGSWGDTLDDAEVLEMVRKWNERGG